MWPCYLDALLREQSDCQELGLGPQLSQGALTGCLHPDYDGFLETPAQYLKWYSKHGPLKDMDSAPRVAVLLYRYLTVRIGVHMNLSDPA